MSYLFVNICSLPHDYYIFTCNKILDKKLQETFVLEIKNDKEVTEQKTIFTTSKATHLMRLENDFTH